MKTDHTTASVRVAIILAFSMLFLVLSANDASAQTAIYSCTYDITSCGFDLAPSNGVLNVTSSTLLNWNASLYTWSNVTMMVYAPTGAQGFKHSITEGNHRWFIDGTDWKIEPDYSTSKSGYTLDAWIAVNIVTNHTSNTSTICFGGTCSTTSAGAFKVDPAENRTQLTTTHTGGDIAYDNMTIYVLDNEAPVDYTLVDHAGLDNNLTQGVLSNVLFSQNQATFFGNGYLTKTASSTINLSGGFSMSAWAQWNNTQVIGSNERVIFRFSNGSSYPYLQLVYRNTSTPQVYARFQFNASVCDKNAALSNVSFQSSGDWNHFAGVFDGSVMQLYVNGINRANSTSFSDGCLSLLNTMSVSNGLFRVGQSGANNLTGLVDDARFYNTTLTSSQISSVYQNQSVSCSNLDTWYPFTQNSLENCTEISDSTAPGIVNVTTIATTTTIQVNITTNESANRTLTWGLNTSLLNGTLANATMNTSGIITITGLPHNTTIYFNLTLTDASGNQFSNGTYNATTGYFQVIIDGPSNAIVDADGSITFLFTPSTTSTLANCSIGYNGGVTYETLTTVVNGSQNSLTVNNVIPPHVLAASPLEWNVTCADTDGILAYSPTYLLTTYVVPSQPTSSAGGGSSEPGITGITLAPYTLSLDIERETYRPGQTVRAPLIIDYQGTNPPGTPGTLTYTVRDPSGDEYPPETLTYTQGSYEKTLLYTLPDDTVPGDYSVVAKWTVPGYPPVKSEIVFTVGPEIWIPPVWALITIGIVALILILGIGITIMAGSSRRK